MATETQDVSRTLGRIEGRLDEHSVRLDRLDAGLQQINDRLFRLMLAIFAVGGGIIAVLIGLLITLIVRGTAG